jgi:HEAT repeat protein
VSVRAVSLSDDERERVDRVEHLARVTDVDALVRLLTEPSWAVRRAVIAALARIGTPAVRALVDVLVGGRGDETRLAATVDVLAATTADVDADMLELAKGVEPAVVCDAIQVLGRRRSRAALPRLIALATHRDDNVAVAALEALGRIGGVETVDALVAAVEAKHFFRTFPALDALGRTGDVRAVRPLAALLADPLYVAEAARALGRTGQEQAVAPLANLLARPTDVLVRTAVVALAELRERYESRFGDTPEITRALPTCVEPARATRRIVSTLTGVGTTESVATARVLAWLGDALAITTLLEMIMLADPVGAAAIDALRRLASAATPYILAAIVEGNSAQRARLLPILGASAHQSDALVLCLEDPDADVKVRACEALARLGDTRHVAALFRCIGDRDTRVSQAAAAAIQSLGSRETKTLSLEQARSNDARTRRAALRIIAYFGYPEGLDVLVSAMTDDDEKIREAAIYGLPLIDDARALEALLGQAAHPDARTRAAITRALGQTEPANAVVEALRRALGDEDAWVRYYATQSLGRLKVGAAAPWLIERMADVTGQVRVAAVESLAHLDDARAEDALVEAARSDDLDMRRAALLGLGISRRPRALP